MPQGSRTDRVGDLIRDELSSLLVRQVGDPAMRLVTVTRVRMTKDLLQARVYYTVLTDALGLRKTAQALRRARPFFKRQLGQRLRLRHVPELMFFYDDSVEQQDRVARLLDEIAASRIDNSSPDDNSSS